jgi:hypothetical protein
MQRIIQTLSPPLAPLAADLLDCALDGARLNFGVDGYLRPALITGNYSTDKPGTVILLPNMNPENKPAITAFINQQRRQNDICALVEYFGVAILTDYLTEALLQQKHY